MLYVRADIAWTIFGNSNRQSQVQRLSYGRANLVLDIKSVSQNTVEALRPQVESIFHANQVDGDANAVS
jgi:hypothetical protein